MATLLSCGCAAVAWDQNKNPVCLLHESTPIKTPDLSDRKARCSECAKTVRDSDIEKLAYFKYKPDQKEDSFYCGCFGWD